MRALLVAALVTVTATAANAGTYIGVGVGTGASVGDSLNNSYKADGRSARLALGYRIGPFSIEGMYSGYGYMLANGPGTGLFDSRTLQLAAKYNFALADHFELYGRLGLLRTDLTARDTGADSQGTGYTGSLGVEYRLDLLVTGFGVYMDWTRNQATFDNGNGTQLDQSASMWTLGANLSF
ncbi:MAG TPA: outer membrane beta-barrel protein [Kofleriaceae bacterium]|nr:outer membrane beta-barrel protein [Kofleriaceae bacterium]